MGYGRRDRVVSRRARLLPPAAGKGPGGIPANRKPRTRSNQSPKLPEPRPLRRVRDVEQAGPLTQITRRLDAVKPNVGVLGKITERTIRGSKKPNRKKTNTNTATSGTGSRSGGTSAPSGRPQGKSKGERDRSRENTAKGREKGEQTAEETKPSSGLFDAARRQLDKEATRMAELRAQRIREMEKFDAYVQQARAQANGTLAQQYAALNQQATEARTGGAARVADLANQAAAQVGGTLGTAAASGITATNDAFGFIHKADGVASAANAFTQANLTTRNTERQNEDLARGRDFRGDIDRNYDEFLTQLDRKRAQLEVDEIKASIEQANADRQFALDEQANEFLQDYRRQQLGIEQTDAETRRLNAETQRQVAINNANYREQSLNLKAQIESGRLTLRQAELQWRKRIDKAKLKSADKDRALRIGLAQIRLAESADRRASTVTKGGVEYLRKFVNDRVAAGGKRWNEADDGYRYNTTRAAITALKAQYPNLTATQATQILAAQFGGDYLAGNGHFRDDINRYWPRRG